LPHKRPRGPLRAGLYFQLCSF